MAGRDKDFFGWNAIALIASGTETHRPAYRASQVDSRAGLVPKSFITLGPIVEGLSSHCGELLHVATLIQDSRNEPLEILACGPGSTCNLVQALPRSTIRRCNALLLEMP